MRSSACSTRRTPPASSGSGIGHAGAAVRHWHSVSELIALDVDDLNLSAGVLRCASKGKERVIPLYQTAVRALSEYLHRVRPQLVESPSETALFVNMSGDRMSRQAFGSSLSTIRKRRGIEKDITPHNPPPLLCRPSAGERGGSALHPGDAGPCGYLLHPDLFQAAESEAQGRLPQGPSQGVTTAAVLQGCEIVG